MILENSTGSIETASLDQLCIRKCQQSRNSLDHFDYCIKCQVLMPKDNAETGPFEFFRTKEYFHPDQPHVNPNNILENLIKNQSINRFYNKDLKHVSSRSLVIDLIEELCTKFDYSKNCIKDSNA